MKINEIAIDAYRMEFGQEALSSIQKQPKIKYDERTHLDRVKASVYNNQAIFHYMNLTEKIQLNYQ